MTETKTLPAAESSEPKPKKQDQPKVAADTINDGTHNVGVDVKAGKYKTSVPEGEFCYWERIRGDDISDSTSTYKEGPARLSVTLKKGDVFRDRGLRHVEEGLTAAHRATVLSCTQGRRRVWAGPRCPEFSC